MNHLLQLALGLNWLNQSLLLLLLCNLQPLNQDHLQLQSVFSSFALDLILFLFLSSYTLFLFSLSKTSIPRISEDEARQALLEMVSSHCCYGKTAARELIFTNITSSSAFHVRVTWCHVIICYVILSVSVGNIQWRETDSMGTWTIQWYTIFGLLSLMCIILISVKPSNLISYNSTT